VSGTTDLCYDGTAFFGNSHTARADEGSAQDNLLAGTGTTTSAFAADLSSSKAAMLGFLDEAGEPFHGDGVVGLTCVVPVELEKVAREVLGASMISNTSNVAHQGMAELIVSPRLSDANDWYLCRTDAAAKALIFQDRQPVEFEALEGSSDAGFSRRQYQYGVSARYNVGYGFWQSATKTVNS
jgi:phage major head subunit gpT-like protein